MTEAIAADTLDIMSESSKKPLIVLAYAALVLSTLLVYWQVHDFDFINHDDDLYVYENPYVSGGLTLDSIAWAFTADHAANWHPVTWLSLMLDRQLFGGSPGWMHVVNLLLHMANTLLLFAILRKMTGLLWASAFVAAAFALHPMHVESVAWIAERKDVLSTLFWLLTMAAYVAYVRSPGASRYVLALLLFAVGLMAKPMLVTLPFVLLLCDYWPLGRFAASRSVKTSGAAGLIAEKIPFIALAGISSAVTFLVQRSGGVMAGVDVLPLRLRLANAILSYAKYIGKMLWPQDLAVFYPFDIGQFPFWQTAISAAILLGISVLVIRLGRSHRYLPVGWFWFVGTLVPVIGLVQVGSQALADRYTYIPYIGLFIMIAWGLPELLSRWSQRKVVLGFSMAMALTALGICAHKQAGYWDDSVTLFSRAIEVTHGNDLAYNNRGVAYLELGRSQEAIADFSQAIGIRPDYAEAYYNRGYACGKLGRREEAIADFSQAIAIRPGLVEAHTNLGIVYAMLGRWQEAIDALGQAIKVKPDHAEAYANLGMVYGDIGRYEDAVRAYERAIEIRPDVAEVHNNLANVLGLQNRSEEALDQYRAALALRPDWPACMNDMAFLIAAGPGIKNRDTDEAIRLASRACELTGYREPSFLDTLAIAYASAGRFSEAVDTARRAINLADAMGQPQTRNIIQHHLSFYTQGRPYVEAAPESVPDSNRP